MITHIYIFIIKCMNINIGVTQLNFIISESKKKHTQNPLIKNI